MTTNQTSATTHFHNHFKNLKIELNDIDIDLLLLECYVTRTTYFVGRHTLYCV